MSATDELLKNNERYAATFDKGATPLHRRAASPSSRAWTPACTSARSSASRSATRTSFATPVAWSRDDAIRSLVISQRLLGTKEIILIHHTDCGMVTFSETR